MLKISYQPVNLTQAIVRNYITQQRSRHINFRVIDIGGLANGWSGDLANIIVDIQGQESSQIINFDICLEKQWKKLFDYVQDNGQFDYAICTHTLEDIYNPFTTLENLPKIARAGIITMPSIYTELSKLGDDNYLGYIHHRWLFDQEDGHMMIIPKLSLLEGLIGNRSLRDFNKDEISFEWIGEIPYKIFMNNYLGPNPETVMYNYIKTLKL